MATLRLPKLLRRNVAPTPGLSAAPRPDSPPSGSTLTTSAPEAAEQLRGVGQRLHLLGGEHPHAVERPGGHVPTIDTNATISPG